MNRSVQATLSGWQPSWRLCSLQAKRGASSQDPPATRSGNEEAQSTCTIFCSDSLRFKGDFLHVVQREDFLDGAMKFGHGGPSTGLLAHI